MLLLQVLTSLSQSKWQIKYWTSSLEMQTFFSWICRLTLQSDLCSHHNCYLLNEILYWNHLELPRRNLYCFMNVQSVLIKIINLHGLPKRKACRNQSVSFWWREFHTNWLEVMYNWSSSPNINGPLLSQAVHSINKTCFKHFAAYLKNTKNL